MEFVSKISSILADIQGWILLLVGAVTTVRIAKRGDFISTRRCK